MLIFLSSCYISLETRIISCLHFSRYLVIHKNQIKSSLLKSSNLDSWWGLWGLGFVESEQEQLRSLCPGLVFDHIGELSGCLFCCDCCFPVMGNSCSTAANSCLPNLKIPRWLEECSCYLSHSAYQICSLNFFPSPQIYYVWN